MMEQGVRPTLKPADKERKTRSDKKIAVLSKLDQETHRKLKRLALACDVTKTKLAEEILTLAVNHPDIVKYYQDKYHADEFRIIPIFENGSLQY